MTAGHHLSSDRSEPPPIERKQIALPAFAIIGVILALVALGRLGIVFAFLCVGAVVFVCSQIRSSENRKYMQRRYQAESEAERIAGELRYHAAQRRHYEEHGEYFAPETYDPGPRQYMRMPAQPAKSGWSTAATVMAVVAVIAGLAMLAFIILFMVAMSNYGSNK